MDCFALVKSVSRTSAALAVALVSVLALDRPVQAATYWSDSAPTSVSDLMNGDYWTNGAPTSTDNPGFIAGKTLTVTSDFNPGADGQNVDLTFGQGADVTMNNAFVPLANLASGQKGTVTFRLTDNANVYVGGNFWGGTNDHDRSYTLAEGEFQLYQYYGGDSTFSSNEWWSAMSVKTYMKISDNAVVIARGGNSGMGWDDQSPYSSYGSVLELTDNGTLNINSTNLNIWGTDTTINMFGNSTFTANTVFFSHDKPQVNLYDNSKFTISNTLKVDDKAAVSVNGNSTFTVANDFAMDRNGALTVTDNAVVNLNRQVKIGDSNNGEAGGAVFTQTGGKVTTSNTTFFSFHSDATINLSGGQFICNSSELYVTDQRGCKAVINMTDDGYLQCNDLRLSQHGHVDLTMSGNSQIKASTVNAAYNYDPGDNVVNVNILNDSANITANNLNFFGRNTNGGAAYGSLTLNDNSTVVISNEVKVGLGVATDLLEGKDYAAEITLNGNSKFSTKTFTTNATAKSATSLNGSAILEAETIDLAANTFLNVNGGTVNITTLNNEGTVNLAGGAITLTPYGLITSTAGTFNATSGAVNITVPAGVSYNSGDQMIVGFFADDATASAVSGKTVVPEGWQKSVVTMGESKAVVASYGDTAPTGVKIWTGAAEGDTSMGNAANWEGDAANPTGYVLDGTNTLSGITGKTVFLGGSNTLSGDTPYGATLSVNGGIVQYNGAIVRGSLLMNGGTFIDSGELKIGDETNGVNNCAVFTQTDGIFTATGTSFFSFHADAKVDLSGGQCIIQGGQLYVTDKRGCTADITMTNDSYLQAKDLRLSQHGMTTLTMSDNSHLSVTTFNLGFNYSAGDNVESIVTMSGNSRLDDSGNFIVFQGNNEQNHSGAAYASFTMSDNAYAYIGGNAWGGSDDGDNVPGLITGKDYNLEMTFKDNSYFSSGEFWMAMAGKTHITIQDNATVIARSGNSGMGWCEKTDGSLLEIKGGTLQVDSEAFHVGHEGGSATTGRANVQQTGGTASFKVLNIRHADSGYYISGADSVMTANEILTAANSTLSVAGGTVNVGSGGISGAGTIALSGGTITSDPQRGSWTGSANATLTGTGATFAPAAGTSITWSGVLSGDGGLIVNGDGTFTLAAAPTYTGLTSVQNGTFEVAADATIGPIEMAANTGFKVTSAAATLSEENVTLNNLSGENGTINATNLTLNNDAKTKYTGTINATSITKTGEGTTQLNTGSGMITAQNVTATEGRLDLQGKTSGGLTVKKDAVFSPGNSVGTAEVGGEFTLEEGGILLLEQDPSGMDLLKAASFDVDSGIIDLEMASTQPGAKYPVIQKMTGAFGTDYQDEFWNSLLSSTSAYYWDLTVEGNTVFATIDASAVPEPTAWILLLLGAFGLVYWRKK